MPLVTLYRIPIAMPDHVLTRLSRLLSPDERARAGRYHFEKDRSRFIASRGAMRIILGAHLHLAPERVGFCYGEQGKPALAKASADQPLSFNLSDSGDWAVLGVTGAGEIGVDIEALRPIPEITSIAERFFAPSEEAWLRSHPLHDQPWTFHRIWTCKEAYLKALGTGLSLNTQSFAFDFTVKPARLIGPDTGWRIIEFTPAPSYAGAVCVPGEGWEISLRDWMP
ncbi:MAG TPA: 4'-phosphopantetheinyl transferase superfamily protein [Symbiobacteriaceae bacterium]|nr:4'-phosphopantetheinyl transferase superfamily protein [Symbiobacteriaceae bacterium]